MEKKFKLCYVSYNKVYVVDEEERTFTISMQDLMIILNNAPLKATKKIKHYKLEAE